MAADGTLPRLNCGTANNPKGGPSTHSGFLRTLSDWTLQRAGGESPANSTEARCVETLALSANRPGTRTFALPDSALACLQLFAGETTYGTAARKVSLKAMLAAAPPNASAASSQDEAESTPACDEPIYLVDMRGNGHCYPYSDVEEVCKEVAREYEAANFPRSDSPEGDGGTAGGEIDAESSSEAA
jgi:hypothetical protein